jgi:heme/copper-type cytochrome/quinol oxidase subunit 4
VKYIISNKSLFKKRWDIFILVLAVQNTLFIPVELAFSFAVFQSTAWKVFSNLVDTLFIVDIVLMFFTSFQNKMGKQIYSSFRIAKNYMQTSRFVFDVLSVLGTAVFQLLSNKMAVFGFFKLARINRLSKFINELNMPEDTKAAINLIKLLFYLIIILNVQGCVWWYTVGINKDEFAVYDGVARSA